MSLWFQLISSSQAFAFELTTRHGDSNLTIQPHQYLRAMAWCARGEEAVGGGYLKGSPDVSVGESQDVDANYGRDETGRDGWVIGAINNGSIPQSLEVSVNCIK